MAIGNKVKDWKKLNDEFGFLAENYNYNISGSSIKTRPLSFLLWSVSYLIDNFVPALSFEDVAFMLMISDFKYFEMHVLEKRTGWGRSKCDAVVGRMVTNGYLHKERPSVRKHIYKNLVVNLEYKYTPTRKYKSILRDLEINFEKVFKEYNLSIGKAELPPRQVKGSPS